MTAVKQVAAGGFAYLPSTGRTFSRGVIALEGFVLRRISLMDPLPMESGLDFAAEFIRAEGRPLEAFCGCELRVLKRLSREEFSDFNRRYIAALRSSGFPTDPSNPAARTNMVPATDPPRAAVLSAFTFAVPGTSLSTGPDFLISGKPELASDPDRVIAPGDTSPSGIRMKAAFVLEELRRTVQELGAQWESNTVGQIYTKQSVADLEGVFASAGLPLTLCTHVPGDPPVFGPDDIPLEFEADIRSITVEEMA